MFQCELRARPDVTFYWRNRYRYNIAKLCLTLCRAEKVLLPCGTSKRRGPRPLESNTSSIFSSPNNRGGTEQSVWPWYIYIYVSCESCRLERIYLSQFGRPQPPKVPVLSVRANVTNFLENFLGFPRTMQVFFIDNWDLVVAADVWILKIADLILSWVEKIFSFLCIPRLVMKFCI